MAAVKIQHKNCFQSTLRKKIINTLFAGLSRSVLGKTVPSVLRPRAQFFPIRTSRPANNIYKSENISVEIEKIYIAYIYIFNVAECNLTNF